MKSSLSSLIGLAASCCILGMLAGCTAQSAEVPVPRLVVIADCTASFQKHLGTVAAIVNEQIRTNALEGETEIYLIRLDHRPEVIARFGAEELISSKGSRLLDGLGKVGNGVGTDVVGALELAVHKLNRPPVPPRRFLLVFSDLIVDNAPGRRFSPIEAFSWNRLAGVHSEFYFVDPAVQKLVEQKPEAVGVGALLHEPAESQSVKLTDTSEE